jgi:anthranilate phosphoribosyltransferase
MPGRWNSDILKSVMARKDLSVEQARDVFNAIMDGALAESQIAAILVAMAVKGETVEEITGAAMAMRAHVRRIDGGAGCGELARATGGEPGADVVDTCGTGGTGLKTFNISTAAALVACGAGVRVAKHGNRTATRPSGSADVLAALGVHIDADEQTVTRCLAEAGICFCFAIRHHPAMKFAAPVRKALGVRTLFNLLGPLTNPAGAMRQLMGVYDGALVEPIARVLLALGAQRAMVVHAADGLDEISTTSPTLVGDVADGAVTTRHIEPEDFGIARARMDELLVTTVAESAQRVKAVLAGQLGPARDIVLLNAAAAITVAGKAPEIAAGLLLAGKAIDTGAAMKALERLVAISNGR